MLHVFDILFFSKVNQRTTYTDPRLAFARDIDVKTNPVLKQRFDSFSTAELVLLGTDLTGKVAIVTGANSGVGK